MLDNKKSPVIYINDLFYHYINDNNSDSLLIIESDGGS